MLCALTASAVSYATPYMGSGRGFIHTTSSAHVHSIGNGGGGMASAPVASMSSVSGRGITTSAVASTRVSYSSGITSAPRVRSGIYTSASAIHGGVTTEETGHHHGGGVKTSTPPPPSPGTPGYCEHCHYIWVEDPDDEVHGGYWVCSECGKEIGECECDDCQCVPIDEEWHVWLFVSLIAALYALIKVKRERLAVKRETI